MSARITILDEVNVSVTGLEPRDINFLYDKFSIYAKGFRHQVKFKLGRWDGKIQHFSKQGKTYVKLLPEIIKYLRAREYSIKLVDNRQQRDLSIPPIDENYLIDRGYEDIKLGAHQVRGINALTKAGGEIFEGGTGAGKTLMTAVLAQLYEEHHNFRTIVIVPTKDLITQTRNEMVEFGVDAGLYGAEKDLDHTHIVSTWQTLQKNPAFMGQFQAVIVDECHGVTGDVLRSILNDAGAKCAVRIGLTGTLPEEEIDQMAVRITLGNVIEKVEASELIACGWLAELKLYSYELVEDLRQEFAEFIEKNPKYANITYKQYKSGKHSFPDYTAEKKYLQKKEERLDFLSKLIATTGKQNTLILVPNVEFGRKLARSIEGATFFSGKDTSKIRQQLYSSFNEENGIIAITTYALASTGLNIKRIFNLFLIDAGKSYVQVIQSIGRGLRRAPDKDKVWVYDVYSDTRFSKTHGGKRKTHYKKKNYKFTHKKVDYINLLI
jgi:superfamily II DNA or RNA helicase